MNALNRKHNNNNRWFVFDEICGDKHRQINVFSNYSAPLKPKINCDKCFVLFINIQHTILTLNFADDSTHKFIQILMRVIFFSTFFVVVCCEQWTRCTFVWCTCACAYICDTYINVLNANKRRVKYYTRNTSTVSEFESLYNRTCDKFEVFVWIA